MSQQPLSTEEDTVVVTVRVPRSLHDILSDRAAHHGTTRSAFLRALIRGAAPTPKRRGSNTTPNPQ